MFIVPMWYFVAVPSHSFIISSFACSVLTEICFVLSVHVIGSLSGALGIDSVILFSVIMTFSAYIHTVLQSITKTRLFKYIENFTPQKTENIQIKNSDIFFISAQNIDCGYSLEPPRRGGSNEYPQSMFCAEIRKILYTHVNPSFTV